MFTKYAKKQFEIYNDVRSTLVTDPTPLLNLEYHFASLIHKQTQLHLLDIQRDYNEASHLYSFWKNYPPEERGRAPKGDQFPWIEVGEHALGSRIIDFFAEYEARDVGIPSGSDQRYLLKSKQIYEITKGLTDSAWIFIDIKSAGPRDDAPHTVMSHNQISGDGKWETIGAGVQNTILTATGKRTSHPFHCSIPPVYILSDGTIAPVIIIAIKPLYSMLSLSTKNCESGQPLDTITQVTIPNGIPLTVNPNYLDQFPNLLFPGKDDKGKNPLKVRARVSFEVLKKIDEWRVLTTKAI